MKRFLFVILLLFLYTSISHALTTTVDVDSTAAYYHTNATYATARDTDSAGSEDHDYITVGQNTSAGDETVWRTLVAVVMPAISGDISAVDLCFYANVDHSTTDFDIYLVGAADAGPAFATEDYSHFDGRQTAGVHDGELLADAWDSNGWNAGDVMTISFNAAGICSVTAAQKDTLWLAIISKEDYLNSEPSDDEYVYIDDEHEGEHRPYLSITSAFPASGTTNVASDAVDGYAMEGGVGYAETWILARDVDNADAGGKWYVGVGWQEYDGGENSYRNTRGFVAYTLPTMASVTACSLFFHAEAVGSGDASDQEIDIWLLTAYYGEGVITKEDYELFDGRETGTAHTGVKLNETYNTVTYDDVEYHYMVFNQAGLDSLLVYQGSTIQLVFLSGEDYDYTETPTDTRGWIQLGSRQDEDKYYTSLSIKYSDEATSGYTGTAMGLDGPAGAMGVGKANLKNFLGVE